MRYAFDPWPFDQLPDGFKDLTINQVIGFALVVLFLWWVAKKVYHAMSGLKDRYDDLFGEKARDGVDRRPGLLERQAAIEEAVQEIRYHVQPNGGGSSHDAVMERLRALELLLEEHIRHHPE